LTARIGPAKKEGLPQKKCKRPDAAGRPSNFCYLKNRGVPTVSGISDRKQEIKRRRSRRKKLAKLATRLKKATTSEKLVIVTKLRNMTPGAEVIIENWGLKESDR
jgi:hypothetical protein